MMMSISILILIVAKALSSLQKQITSINFTRISSLILIISGLLAFNLLYIQSIGSGIGIYSGFYQISSISQTIEMFFFLLFLINRKWIEEQRLSFKIINFFLSPIFLLPLILRINIKKTLKKWISNTKKSLKKWVNRNPGRVPSSTHIPNSDRSISPDSQVSHSGPYITKPISNNMPYSITSLPEENPYPYSFDPEDINQPFEDIPSNSMTLQQLSAQIDKMLRDMNLFLETRNRGLYREIGIVREGSGISLQNPNDILTYIESRALSPQLTSHLIDLIDLNQTAAELRSLYGLHNPVRIDPSLAEKWNQFKINTLTTYPDFHSSTLDYNKPVPQENNPTQDMDFDDLGSVD